MRKTAAHFRCFSVCCFRAIFGAKTLIIMKIFPFRRALVLFGAALSLGSAPFFSAAHAQTGNAPSANSGPNLGAENMRAISILGQAYGKVLDSQGYRGHIKVSKVGFVPGQGTVAKVLDWKSGWQNGANGEFSRRWKDVVLVETKGGQTTTQKYTGVDEGELTKRFYPDKKAWSEKPIRRETDVSVNFVRAPLQMAVLLAAQGAAFEVVSEKRDGADVKIVRAGNSLEVVLEPQTLTMKNWRVTRRNGETETCVWLQNEMNPTFKADEWAFKTPADAKKVAPETVTMQLEF